MSNSPIPYVRRSLMLGGLLVAVLATTAAMPADTTADTRGAFRHTRLLRSIPGKDSVITASPATIQLWFSEKVELGLSRVRVEGADGKSVSLSPLTQDAKAAGSPVVGRVPAPLADGTYTVQWTAASADGHAVKGRFAFTVKSR